MTSLRTYATAALRRLAVLAGGVLLSRRAHRQLLLQRARAVQALTDIEIRVLTEGLTGVVFSKDRALQLYTLLSTYTRFVTNPAPLVVLYAASTAAHANAYSELQAAFSGPGLNVQFVSQGPVFKESLQAILDDTITKNIFFLVDDIIFIRPVDFSLASRLDTSNSILSLRHSPHLRRSYTASVPQSPPNFDVPKDCPGLLQFRWFEQKNEWSNPWSVDGQILSTAEIRVLTRISEFWAPNSYEGALTTFNDLVTDRLGLCYPESKILNLPINRVQSEVANRNGDITSEYLLEKWNQGMTLDTSSFDAYVPESPHEEHSVLFKRRLGTPLNVDESTRVEEGHS